MARAAAIARAMFSLEAITLKALLNAAALRRGIPREARFCATETCAVVYFDRSGGVVFTESDLSVVVHAKPGPCNEGAVGGSVGNVTATNTNGTTLTPPPPPKKATTLRPHRT